MHKFLLLPSKTLPDLLPLLILKRKKKDKSSTLNKYKSEQLSDHA